MLCGAACPPELTSPCSILGQVHCALTGVPLNTVGYTEQSLTSGEEIAYRSRYSRVIYVPGSVVLIGAVLVAIAGITAAVIAAPIGLLMLIAAFARSLGGEFAITSRRVICKSGIISRRTVELQLSRVESIAVDQDLGGRLLGYGSIVVTGSGGTKERFDNIADPMGFRRAVLERQS